MIHHIKEGHVLVEHKHGITGIEFFHPHSNALPSAILQALAHEIHSAGMDDDTKVILLRSAGEGAFCAGASLRELKEIENEQQGKQFFSGFASVINTMRKCPKLIIARVQGKSVGGGVGLIAAADYAIGMERSDIKLSELSIGIGPFVVAPVIEKKMGVAAFSQMAIDATMWRPADWARKRGLFAELHPDVESMDESVNRLANVLLHSGTEAMLALKKIIWTGTDNWDELLQERAAISGALVVSPAAKAALAKL